MTTLAVYKSPDPKKQHSGVCFVQSPDPIEHVLWPRISIDRFNEWSF